MGWRPTRIQILDIPAKMVNLSQECFGRVFQPSLTYRKAGWTSNPDVWWINEVKLAVLLIKDDDMIEAAGARMATGHYARTDLQAEENQLRVHRRPSPREQTYQLLSILPLPHIFAPAQSMNI